MERVSHSGLWRATTMMTRAIDACNATNEQRPRIRSILNQKIPESCGLMPARPYKCFLDVLWTWPGFLGKLCGCGWKRGRRNVWRRQTSGHPPYDICCHHSSWLTGWLAVDEIFPLAKVQLLPLIEHHRAQDWLAPRTSPPSNDNGDGNDELL